jgi:hypothetical protein
MRPGDSAKATSWTKTPFWKLMPRARSHATSGSMNVSYWSNGVRQMFAMSEMDGNMCRVRLR